MIRKAATSIPTRQGRIDPSYPDFGALYETRHGMFGGGRTLFDPNATTAQAADTTTTTSPAQGAAAGGEGEGSQLARSLQNLIARSGGSDRTAELLFNENRDYRARIRELEGQLPAQGAVVLTAEQAQQWAAFQALGPDPAALATRLTEGTAALEREQGRTLAEASGANPDVLADRLRATGLRAEVREVPATATAAAGRAVHVLDAQGADQGELRAYAQQHWAPFVPALFPAAAAGTQGVSGTVVSGQAGAGASTTAVVNPIGEALSRRTPTAEGAPRVVDALSFTS